MEKTKYGILSLLLLLAITGYGKDNGSVMTGFVLNQDYEPVADALVRLDFTGSGKEVSALTDDYGHFLITLEGLMGSPIIMISAAGFPEHKFWGYQYDLPQSSLTPTFMISNAANFHTGQLATIFLPTPPDAELGLYYRLDRVKDKRLMFERELNPKADIPYLIFPNRDFTIDYPSMDLTDKWVEQSFPEVSFCGFYAPTTYLRYEKELTFLVDKTPDCDYRYVADHFSLENGAHIGALRALFTLKAEGNWTNIDKDSRLLNDDWRNILVFHDGSKDSTFTYTDMVNRVSSPKRTALAGVVTDQTQSPIAQAVVRLKNGDGTVACETKTDKHGHFLLPVADSSRPYEVTVCAEGYPEQLQYRDGWLPFDFSRGSLATKLTLTNKAIYKAGQLGSCIFPATPDPSLGSFYKLDKVENDMIVFARELNPMARVPYLITPARDFSIEYPEQTTPSAETSIPGISLKASFGTQTYQPADHELSVLLDKTAECGYIYESEHSKSEVGCYAGPMRAVLVIDTLMFKGISSSILKSRAPSLYDIWILNKQIELRDVETGMPIADNKAKSQHPFVFDLQGRRLAAPPAKGIYVKGGRKVVVE